MPQHYTHKIILPVCSVSLHSSTKIAKTKLAVVSVKYSAKEILDYLIASQARIDSENFNLELSEKIQTLGYRMAGPPLNS